MAADDMEKRRRAWPFGHRPGLDEAIAVSIVVAVVATAQPHGLWPEAARGVAGTLGPAIAVAVLVAVRVLLGRGGRGRGGPPQATGETAGRDGARGDDDGGRRPPEGGGPGGRRRAGEADRDHGEVSGAAADPVRVNAGVLAPHLPDPTMWPPTAANDDEDRPRAI